MMFSTKWKNHKKNACLVIEAWTTQLIYVLRLGERGRDNVMQWVVNIFVVESNTIPFTYSNILEKYEQSGLEVPQYFDARVM